jgi:hypothetical protein
MAGEVLDLGGQTWRLADPFLTQEPTFDGVPATSGLYLWLKRDRPGPDGRATDCVLYAGRSSDLRRRLRGYSSLRYRREDPVLRALFDRIIAPRLSDGDLRAVVEQRRVPGLTQMWVRDQVVFAWLPAEKAGLSALEKRVIADLRPQFNPIGAGWTRYEGTEHHDHDLTLPIVP